MKISDRDAKEILLRRELLRSQAAHGDLMSFTAYTYPDYQIAWHHERIANALSRFARKEIRRLMIFAPPQHGKSELASRRLPAMLHGMYPDDAILACSYNGELASDMTVDTQRIMETPQYKDIFPYSSLTPDGKLSKYARSGNEHELIPMQRADKYWHFPRGNYRSAGIDGSFTGRPGDWLLIDDPYKNRQSADSKATREQIFRNYSSTLKTRMRGEGSILIMHTRWHSDDLAAKLLALAESDPHADKWEVLILPAIRDTLDDESDPRLIGDALWPERFPLKILLANKAINERDFAALYQQQPMAEGGNIIKSDWLDGKFYFAAPSSFDEVIQSWDFAVKDKQKSDYAVGQVWGRKGTDKYLLDQVRGKWDFPESCRQLLMLTRKWPKAHRKLVEDKANGPAVIQTLKKTVTGLVEVPPKGDKVARLHAVTPEFQSGHVYIPDQSIASWVPSYLTEIYSFPSSPNDDQVDATTQALDHLRKAGPLHLPIAGHGGGTLY